MRGLRTKEADQLGDDGLLTILGRALSPGACRSCITERDERGLRAVVRRVVKRGDGRPGVAECFPENPASRQNGRSYAVTYLITEPIGIREVNWSRRAGSGLS